MSTENLRAYLGERGVIGANESRALASLGDIGCTWNDATVLIDTHEVFYTKAVRSRTAYFSREAYRLIKAARKAPVLTEAETAVLSLIDGMPPAERADIYRFSAMAKGVFEPAFTGLLAKMQVTALFNGKRLNENWSTLVYGTARAWETLADIAPYDGDDAAARLSEELSGALDQKDIDKLLGRGI